MFFGGDRDDEHAFQFTTAPRLSFLTCPLAEGKAEPCERFNCVASRFSERHYHTLRLEATPGVSTNLVEI